MPATRAPFLLGVNLPWVRYGDFGANAWHPGGGLSTFAELADVGGRLREARASGCGAVRWFVFCDGRAGIEYDADGVPTGLDDTVRRDFDAALRLVDDAGLRLVPVLFDHLWCAPRRIHSSVQLGGRASALTDPGARGALVDRVVMPVLQSYGHDPVVLAWDVFNEPEWITVGVGTWRPWRTLTRPAMRGLLGALVERVHDATVHLATVGSASARWLDLVRGIGVDVYQPHWYDHLDRAAPLDEPLARRELDRPAWLGEFPTRALGRDAAAICRAAERAGYEGAFAWSLLARDRASRFTEAAPLLAAWAVEKTAQSPGRTARMPTGPEMISSVARCDRASERDEQSS